MNSLNHIAFIMDGNGRWGEKKGKGRNYGHLKGVETVKKIVKQSIKLNIPILTFYVFSSENWKRPEKEKKYLFNLIKRYFSIELNNIIYNEFQSLSDGQKRRGLIARALVYEPDILVLDEPFSNLDIKSNFILNQNLNKLIKQSVNIIYVTHSIESILSKTNRVLLIKEGKIINDGSPYDLINTKTLSDLFNISIKVIEQEGYWRMLPFSN